MTSKRRIPVKNRPTVERSAVVPCEGQLILFYQIQFSVWLQLCINLTLRLVIT